MSEVQEDIRFDLNDDNQYILTAQHRSQMFKRATTDLNLTLPKSVDEVLKRDEIQIEWSKCQNYLADFL